jgi:hypothetical protein
LGHLERQCLFNSCYPLILLFRILGQCVDELSLSKAIIVCATSSGLEVSVIDIRGVKISISYD